MKKNIQKEKKQIAFTSGTLALAVNLFDREKYIS